jgi:hypothetical protein
MEGLDLRFHTDRTMCVAGPTQSGKTHFVLKLLELREEIFHSKISKVKWCYGIYNVDLHQKLRQKGYETQLGLPNINEVEANSICVLDDLLSESETSKDVTCMFTRAAHHLPCFIIFISQTLFPGGKDARTRSLNTHYYVIFKNPRDKLQFEVLARQIAPRHSKVLLEIFEEATKNPHGYLFIDFTQECPDKFRYRTNILQTPVTLFRLL